MKLKLEIHKCFCSTDVFTINGIKASEDDFGGNFDADPGNAEDHGCGDMKFESREPSDDVLKKYKITKKEYAEICLKLEEGLSFGSCGWCI